MYHVADLEQPVEGNLAPRVAVGRVRGCTRPAIPSYFPGMKPVTLPLPAKLLPSGKENSTE